MKKRWLISLVAVLALVAAACSPDEGATTTTAPAATTTTGAAATTTTAPEGIQFDIGVTPAPCEDAVNDGNGCIYLGIISDLTVGPFRALGVPLTAAQTHFWESVNEDGGLDGFDVIIRDEDVLDNEYTPEAHAAAYEVLSGRVVALAQTLGTPTTQAILGRMAEDNTVGAPASWWSGWSFPDVDEGVLLESGASYCFEAMNGMAFMSQALPEGFTWALIRFGGDYGGDYASGAKIAASQLGLGEPLFEHEQTSFAAGGAPDEAVGLILQHTPTLIVMVTGPTEMATIAGGAFQGGHQAFQILGASPTWNVALTANEQLMPLLEAVYKGTVPWGPWDSDTPGHAAMRAAAEAHDQGPNGAYNAGWVWQYPVKALLEAALASGDLTKANLAALSGELTGVDYQDMLPERSFAGDAAGNAVRSTLVVKADSAASDGVSVISPDGAFVSPLSEAYPYEGPCFTG